MHVTPSLLGSPKGSSMGSGCPSRKGSGLGSSVEAEMTGEGIAGSFLRSSIMEAMTPFDPGGVVSACSESIR